MQIVNQTLSQSVPVNVILGIKTVAKVFIGDMIEGARKVQTQWDKFDEEGKKEIKARIASKYPSPPVDDEDEEKISKRRGPLMPEHLVEALRRHRLSREGGSTGQLGLWQLQQHSGVERFGVKVGGKRLMK